MESRSKSTGKLIWILLFFAFTACVIAALLQAAMVYNNISSVLDEEFSVHTGTSYIQSRVRAGDTYGDINVGEFENCSALFCYETNEEGNFVTIIYCYDGYLRELFCESPSDFDSDAGELLIPMDSLQFSKTPSGLIQATCTCGNNSSSIYLSPRAGGDCV